MQLEVTVPEEYLGPVTADLNARRAEITPAADARQAARHRGAGAAAPGCSTTADKVRSLSQGRASSTMEPQNYAPAPDDVLRGFLGGGEFA